MGRRGRFNEAPASLPGKGDSASCGGAADRSFNEAPASLPGKETPLLGPVLQALLASMRPRQVCRGKEAEGNDRVSDTDSASMRPRQVCRGKLVPRIIHR